MCVPPHAHACVYFLKGEVGLLDKKEQVVVKRVRQGILIDSVNVF